MMNMKAVLTALLAITLTAAASAQQGPVPKGVPHLDHVWVVMMENHSYSQLLNNPNAPSPTDMPRPPISPPTTSLSRIPA